MKVTVTEYLNVRVGKPSVNAPCYQYLAPGSEIEVDGTLYKGDMFEGKDTWYKDLTGNYYWSGGVNSLNMENEFMKYAIFPPMLVNLNEMLVKLPFEIRKNKGNGVKIAVLDRGVDRTHLDIKDSVINALDYTGSGAGANDIIGHGTSMASIIASDAFFKTKGVTGVAPASKIISGKVLYDENDPQDFLSVARGIEYAVSQNADIVNLSLGRETKVNDVAEKINKAVNTIFVASTKQWKDTDPGKLLQFPSNCAEVIPVSALTKEYVDMHWDKLPTPLIIIPYSKIWGCTTKGKKYYMQESGSSVSTAIISGVISLIISNNPALKRNKTQMLAELEKYASTKDEAFRNTDTEIHYIYKK